MGHALLWTVSFWVSFLCPPAFAQVAGTVQYQSGELQFYDGNAWRTFNHGTTGSGCSVAGQYFYSTTNSRYEYCNGSSLMNMAGTGLAGSCTVAGQMDYDASYNRFKFCNGSGWTGGSSSITHVQSRGRFLTTNTATIANNAFTSNATSGNLVACAISWDCTTVTTTTVTDNFANSYSKANNVKYNPTNGLADSCVEIWYANNITGGATFTVTANFSANTTYRSIACSEYTNQASTNVLDIVGSGQGTGTTGSYNMTTSVKDGVVFAWVETLQTASAGTGFTARVSQNGNVSQDKNFITSGTVSTNVAISPSAAWAAFSAIFKSK